MIRTANMLSEEQNWKAANMQEDKTKMLLSWQREQFCHDQRNHSDIASLHKTDRIKHYGLHFAKYVGRLARGSVDPIAVERTIVDTALVCLSAANTLHQKLDFPNDNQLHKNLENDNIKPLADATGRFADACEKIDHMEEFVSMARHSNQDILCWVFAATEYNKLDLYPALLARRAELAERQFYIVE
jgi:hypothetical protein